MIFIQLIIPLFLKTSHPLKLLFLKFLLLLLDIMNNLIDEIKQFCIKELIYGLDINDPEFFINLSTKFNNKINTWTLQKNTIDTQLYEEMISFIKTNINDIQLNNLVKQKFPQINVEIIDDMLLNLQSSPSISCPFEFYDHSSYIIFILITLFDILKSGMQDSKIYKELELLYNKWSKNEIVELKLENISNVHDPNKLLNDILQQTNYFEINSIKNNKDAKIIYREFVKMESKMEGKSMNTITTTYQNLSFPNINSTDYIEKILPFYYIPLNIYTHSAIYENKPSKKITKLTELEYLYGIEKKSKKYIYLTNLDDVNFKVFINVGNAIIEYEEIFQKYTLYSIIFKDNNEYSFVFKCNNKWYIVSPYSLIPFDSFNEMKNNNKNKIGVQYWYIKDTVSIKPIIKDCSSYGGLVYASNSCYLDSLLMLLLFENNNFITKTILKFNTKDKDVQNIQNEIKNIREIITTGKIEKCSLRPIFKQYVRNKNLKEDQFEWIKNITSEADPSQVYELLNEIFPDFHKGGVTKKTINYYTHDTSMVFDISKYKKGVEETIKTNMYMIPFDEL